MNGALAFFTTRWVTKSHCHEWSTQMHRIKRKCHARSFKTLVSLHKTVTLVTVPTSWCRLHWYEQASISSLLAVAWPLGLKPQSTWSCSATDSKFRFPSKSLSLPCLLGCLRLVETGTFSPGSCYTNDIQSNFLWCLSLDIFCCRVLLWYVFEDYDIQTVHFHKYLVEGW